MIIYETDSRKVKQGQIFVAIEGHTVDGHNYINDAIKNGAAKIIGTKDIDCSIPYEKVNSSEEFLKDKLFNEYSHLFKDIDFIGVTGTNGKTTTCYLTYQMLNELNIKTAYMGTIGFFYDDKKEILNNTTPDILTFYNLVLKAKEANCKVIVMEVSSHALDMERIYGIKFKIAGFTNLTQDHLDYHKTMDNYFNAKLKILNYLDNNPIIANIDDEYGNKIKDIYKNTISFGKKEADYIINKYEINPDKTVINFNYKNQNYEVVTNLTSIFNVYNYLLALIIINNYGIDINDILNITNNIYPPKGRCETYKVNDSYAVIDYAHTPDAVEKIISSYNILKKGKIITIVGCGGDRDKTKRPIMGKIASELSDYCIFTSDNPRTENPSEILKDIINGVSLNNYEVIEDRKLAIKKGLDILNKDDILLILGKGHEDYQIIGHEKIHLDDSEEVINYVNNK